MGSVANDGMFAAVLAQDEAVSVALPWQKSSISNPVTTPETNATATRTVAKRPPMREWVARMLSTPVCGVELRNAAVAPRLAPLL